MVRYTEEALMQAWRESHGLGLSGHEEWSAGEDHLEALLRGRLRSWYAGLLRTAPAERLPRRDLKDSVREIWITGLGALMLRLPEAGSRLLEVKLPEWDEPVRVFHRPGSPAARRQLDSWRRSTPADPVVILSGETVIIYGLRSMPEGRERVAPDPGARLERLVMTAWPADGSYEFDMEDFPQDDILQT